MPAATASTAARSPFAVATSTDERAATVVSSIRWRSSACIPRVHWTTISNRKDSARYHRTFYCDLARLLARYGKSVPGWTDDNPTE